MFAAGFGEWRLSARLNDCTLTLLAVPRHYLGISFIA
jgi:hypothetical protein